MLTPESLCFLQSYLLVCEIHSKCDVFKERAVCGVCSVVTTVVHQAVVSPGAHSETGVQLITGLGVVSGFRGWTLPEQPITDMTMQVEDIKCLEAQDHGFHDMPSASPNSVLFPADSQSGSQQSLWPLHRLSHHTCFRSLSVEELQQGFGVPHFESFQLS